jgi:hypothetical protein
MDWVQADRSAAVAVAASAASADLVATMLEAHGVRAWHETYASVYPSIAWVEGHRVRVEATDADRARALLAALEVDDVAPLPPGREDGPTA